MYQDKGKSAVAGVAGVAGAGLREENQVQELPWIGVVEKRWFVDTVTNEWRI